MRNFSGFNGIVVRGRYDDKYTYSNVHASVIPSYEKRARNGSKTRPNVLVIGVDSISRSNAVRNLPKTYRLFSTCQLTPRFRYLMNEIGGWEMRGYSKIDDNTFPNIVALLSGHKVTVKTSELPLEPAKDFVDAWPFVWKNFSQMGYTTMLAGTSYIALCYF